MRVPMSRHAKRPSRARLRGVRVFAPNANNISSIEELKKNIYTHIYIIYIYNIYNIYNI